MFWFFDVVLRGNLSIPDQLKSLAIPLAWFIGNGALVFGTFTVFDLPSALRIQEATGVAFLTYLVGFGLTTALICWRKKPSVIEDLHKYLTQNEVEVVLLILRYNVDPAQAAVTLNIPQTEIEETFQAALKKLAERGSRLLESLTQQTRA
jgi:hypothetical protein